MNKLSSEGWQNWQIYSVIVRISRFHQFIAHPEHIHTFFASSSFNQNVLAQLIKQILTDRSACASWENVFSAKMLEPLQIEVARRMVPRIGHKQRSILISLLQPYFVLRFLWQQLFQYIRNMRKMPIRMGRNVLMKTTNPEYSEFRYSWNYKLVKIFSERVCNWTAVVQVSLPC